MAMRVRNKKAHQEVAIKHDSGKAPYDLLDPYFLSATVEVLQHGAEKYGDWNWAAGTFKWSRLFAALMRHLWAFWRGEDTDAEWGLPHLAHAACCLMFLMRYARDGLGVEDRASKVLKP